MLLRLLKGKESKSRFKERFGISSFATRPKGKLIWFHATSIGEVASILPTINVIAHNKKFKGTILLTSTTLGSLKFLQKRHLPPKVIHQLYPIDNFFTIKKFIDFWQPDLTVFIESEFWPYTLTKAAKVNNIISLNTSISDSSFKRWALFKFVTVAMFRKINQFFPQSTTDLKKLHKLGFTNTTYIGNLKYSAPPPPYDIKELENLRKNLNKRKLVLFASTHPGEDKIAIETFNRLKKKYSNLLCILIPRHPIRTTEICKMIKASSFSYILRSLSSNKIPTETNFYIVDTIGETGLFFALAPITVMCGSFVNIGGHNIIEPAQLGSVIISGPYTDSCKDLIEDFKTKEAICFAKNSKECANVINKLWSNPKLLSFYKQNTANLLANKKNILTQVTDNLMQYIK
ncbi:MAG: hypothetical protein HRU36_03890 [Rickettsiales bacterium]|nr:hypothetical protein [Rickettsiales bacterium]